MKKPVLLLTFNRLDYLEHVFYAVAEYKPQKLYISSDGPRDGKVGEKEKIEEIRQWLLSHVNWECEVKTRFLDKNSGGCAHGVSDAVTWFFENEEDGIILEDDCVPNQSFFKYCEELLDRYKNDKRVWHISGDAPLEIEMQESYYFGKMQFCWGWASWADRWKNFSLDLSNYSDENLKKFSKKKSVQAYWKNILRGLQNHKIDSWAYPWAFEVVANGGLVATPAKTLVSNIGATGLHYTNSNSKTLNKKTEEIPEIVHPQEIKINEELTEKIYRKHYGISPLFQLFQAFRKIFEITNCSINSEKYKLITILGFEFKIKK